MITKVVVPLDGSALAERALTPARSLAERIDASLLLMTASGGHDVAEARERLDKQAAELRRDRVETAIVPDRSAAEAIVTEALDPSAVVCMSTHGRSGVGHAMLGSVAEAVLRGSDRPVLVVGPSLDPGCWQFAHSFADGKLLVAIDGSKASETVVPAAAAEWSRLLGLRAWAVKVQTVSIGIDWKREEYAAEAAAAVRPVAEALPDVGGPAQWDVIEGPSVAVSLLYYANHLPASLVVMGTHGRTGLARVALGSVAMHVVHQSHCPVLVVPHP